jgi:hypothetical protein
LVSCGHVLRMIKRRAREAGFPSSTSCHTFRATGITAYLENGGTIENAQAIAAHESPRERIHVEIFNGSESMTPGVGGAATRGPHLPKDDANTGPLVP